MVNAMIHTVDLEKAKGTCIPKIWWFRQNLWYSLHTWKIFTAQMLLFYDVLFLYVLY